VPLVVAVSGRGKGTGVEERNGTPAFSGGDAGFGEDVADDPRVSPGDDNGES